LLRRFLDVCNALAYAHSRGVLHRDLKPANVMLGKFGETLVVDWGLAKTVGSVDAPGRAQEPGSSPIPPSAESTATLMGSVLGTPAYMSPEQATGALDLLTPVSDVFSLGAILATVLTGKPPYQGPDVLDKARRGDWLAPRQVNPRVPAALDAVCRKAMAVRPEDRYATALDLASDVEHWLADEPVAAYPEPWPTRAWRWGRRHRTLVAAVTAAAVVAVVGLWVVLATRAAADRRDAEARRREAEARTAEAEAYERHGLIDGERGNKEDALLWFEKARDTLTRLEITDPLHRKRLARLAYNLATLHRETGKIDRAGEMYGEAIEAYAALVEGGPAAAETLGDLAQAYAGRANLSLVSGRFEETLGDSERAFQFQRQAIALAPEEPRFLLHLATLYNDRSLVHERRANVAAMEKDLEACRKVIDEARALPATKKHVALDRSVRRNLAVLHENQGNLYTRKAQLDKALVEFAAAAELAEGLSRDEPGTLEYERIAAKCGVNAGYAYLQRGNKDQAKAVLGKAVDRLRNMRRRFPRDAEIGFDLANGFSNAAAVSLASVDELPPAKRPEALRGVEENVNEANRILTGMKNNRKDADQIALLQAANFIGLGMLRYQRQEWAEALPWFNRGIDHCQALERSGQAGPDVKVRAVLLQGMRAVIYYRLERFPEALKDVNEALAKGGHPEGFGLVRAAILAKSGSHREGITAAEKLLANSISPANREVLADAACVYSVALEGLTKDKSLSEKQKAETAHVYAARSVDLLRQAIKAGYTKFDKIRDPGPAGDRDLDPLRGRDEFKRFLRELPLAKSAP
jgi:tetratricopeptide (TPR) repeat protein